MNLKNTAASGIKWSTIGTVGSSLFQLLQISILTRFLSKEAFGLVALALVVVQFSSIFASMGLTSAILYRQNVTKKEYSSIYWLNIGVSFFLYLLILLITPYVANFYDQPELYKLVPILAINILLLAMGRQHYTIMQKQFKFKMIANIQLLSYLGGLISAFFLALNGHGVYSLVYSTLFASLIANSLFLIFNVRSNPIGFHFRIKETIPFLKVGGFASGSAILDFFSRDMDVLIIGKLLGTESLGIYSLAKQITLKFFSLINPIIMQVLSPVFSSIQNHKEKLKNSYLTTVKYLAYINFPAYAIIIISSKEILYFLYGHEYADTFPVLSFLAFGYCMTALGNPVGSLQIATGRTDIGFKWTVIRILFAPLFIYVGALWNITIVSFSFALLSVFFIVPSWYIQLKPMVGIRFREYLKQFYKPFLLFVAVLILTYMLGQKSAIVSNLIVNGIIKGIIILTIFVTYIFFFDKKSYMEFYRVVLSVINGKKKTA